MYTEQHYEINTLFQLKYTKISAEHFDILYVVSDNVPATGLPLSRGASIFYMAPEMGTAINIFPKPAIVKLYVPRNTQQLKVWRKT